MCVDDGAQSATATPRAARPWVAKIGGRVLEDDAIRRALAVACANVEAKLGRPVVLVHGGGCMVTDLQNAFGITPKFHEGRRITEPEHVRYVEMALSGAANKTLVRALTAAGLQAVGISGCDGSLVRATPVPELGAVGEPELVNAALLNTLLAGGFTPVVSPISLGPQGEALNVNADEVACAVAVAVQAERLLLLSDVSGVRVQGADLHEILASDVEHLIDAGEIQGGMVPKLRSAALAVQRGVGEVRIGEMTGRSLDDVRGTRVRADEQPA